MKKIVIGLLLFTILVSGCAAKNQAGTNNQKEKNNDDKNNIVEQEYEIVKHKPQEFKFNEQIAVKYAIVALQEFDINTNQEGQLANYNIKKPLVSAVNYNDQNNEKKKIVVVIFQHQAKEKYYGVTRLLLNQDHYFNITSRGYHVSESIEQLIKEVKEPEMKVSKEGEKLKYDVLTDFPENIEKAVGHVEKLRGFGILKRKENISYIYVGSGEKPTGGYDISVDDVRKVNGLTKITVTETSPEPGEGVTTALTYPKVVLKVYNATKNVEVINDQGEKFEDINDESSEADYYEGK